MNRDPARDPVFGEVARALQPRSRAPFGRVPDLVREVGWLGVTFRGDALPLEDRRALEAMRVLRHDDEAPTFPRDANAPATPDAPTRSDDAEHRPAATPPRAPDVRPARGTPHARRGWTTIECPRFALADLAPRSEALAALLAAHDRAVAPPAEPRLMGIVNVTPDSFSDGGAHFDAARAVDHALRLESQGAAILDVGGESTRPGAEPVSEAEELRRVVPVIAALAARTRAVISVDTTKSGVARAALDAGATIVNDVSSGRVDPAMLPLVASRGATFVAMHMSGTPRDMQDAPTYEDVVAEVLAFLRERCAIALEAGVAPDRLWIDPGIGFGKTTAHNVALLRGLHELRSLGLPIVLGVSRKSFLARLHPASESDRERVGGTAAAVTFGILGGAEILRVHDVAVMAQVRSVAAALR